MQKKGLKYLLISLVVIIWGLIVFRVAQGMGRDDALPLPVQQIVVLKPVDIQDTFSLMVDYPDPFKGQSDSIVEDPDEKGGGHNNRSGMPNTQPGLSSAFQGPPVPAFNPADLKYIGFIGTVNTKRKIAIITYKGTEYSVKEKDKVDLLKVLKIDPAFMIVSFKGDRQTINIER